MGLALIGLDWITALSGAATAVCNVGPGLGTIIGPAGNFSALPDAAKWLLTVGMLLGRLEILTVLVLVTPFSGDIEPVIRWQRRRLLPVSVNSTAVTALPRDHRQYGERPSVSSPVL